MLPGSNRTSRTSLLERLHELDVALGAGERHDVLETRQAAAPARAAAARPPRPARRALG